MLSTRLEGIDTRGAVRPAAIPQSLKQPCRAVSDLPAGALSSTIGGRLWGRDRESLGDCRRRHSALVKSVEAIEAQGLADDTR